MKMNFHPVLIFTLVVAAHHVRADWNSSFVAIKLHFDTFIRSYLDEYLKQTSSSVFQQYDPYGAWQRSVAKPDELTGSIIQKDRFILITRGPIEVIKNKFNPNMSDKTKNAIQSALEKLCTDINSALESQITSDLKYGELPLRGFLRDKVYKESLKRNVDDFDRFCPPSNQVEDTSVA